MRPSLSVNTGKNHKRKSFSHWLKVRTHLRDFMNDFSPALHRKIGAGNMATGSGKGKLDRLLQRSGGGMAAAAGYVNAALTTMHEVGATIGADVVAESAADRVRARRYQMARAQSLRRIPSHTPTAVKNFHRAQNRKDRGGLRRVNSDSDLSLLQTAVDGEVVRELSLRGKRTPAVDDGGAAFDEAEHKVLESLLHGIKDGHGRTGVLL